MSSITLNSEVLYLKLQIGIDLLASVIEESSKHLVVCNPIQIHRVISPINGGIQVGMMPWVPMLELMPLNYTFLKNQIVAMVEIPQDGKLAEEYRTLLERYTEQTETDYSPEIGFTESLEDEDEEDLEIVDTKKRVLN